MVVHAFIHNVHINKRRKKTTHTTSTPREAAHGIGSSGNDDDDDGGGGGGKHTFCVNFKSIFTSPYEIQYMFDDRTSKRQSTYRVWTLVCVSLSQSSRRCPCDTNHSLIHKIIQTLFDSFLVRFAVIFGFHFYNVRMIRLLILIFFLFCFTANLFHHRPIRKDISFWNYQINFVCFI